MITPRKRRNDFPTVGRPTIANPSPYGADPSPDMLDPNTALPAVSRPGDHRIIREDGTTFNRQLPPAVARPPQVLSNPSANPTQSTPSSAPPNVGDYAGDLRRRIEENAAAETQHSKPTEKSEDSRLRSGFERAMQSLGEYFSPKYGMVSSWGEFFSRLGAVPGAFAGGMINDKWDEEDKRLRNLDRTRSEGTDLRKQEDQYYQTLARKKQIENSERDDKARDERDRESQKFRLRQQLLGQISKQGFYRKGANAEFDKQLTDAEIELSDFDGRRRETREQAGKFFTKNPDTQAWEESQGMPVDPSEVPITANIGGVPMQIAPKQIAPMLFQQGQNQFNQAQQNYRQQNQFQNESFERKQQLLGQSLNRWQTNFASVNGRMPTESEIEQARSAIMRTLFGQ